ncbi:MAG: tRNA pseudouridine(38-40) synthase TruA [Methanobacteriaceae archaeon]
MRQVALKIAYIGSNFYGFQRQPNVRTVEGELIKAFLDLEIIEDVAKSRFSLGGRTDRGVHALGNVISFRTDKEIYINQVNAILPKDVQIIATAKVQMGFKPRYAESRYYRYLLLDDDPDDLNIELMKKVASYFIGEHDFTNFSKKDSSKSRNPIRKIDKLEIVSLNDPIGCDLSIEALNSNKKNTKTKISPPNINYNNKNTNNNTNNNSNNNNINTHNNNTITNRGNNTANVLAIDIVGESFLWNMVRKIATIIVAVGKGDLESDSVLELLNPTENRINVENMPAEYLMLMNTQYPKIKFNYDEYACEGFLRTLIEEMELFRKRYLIKKNFLLSACEFLDL